MIWGDLGWGAQKSEAHDGRLMSRTDKVTRIHTLEGQGVTNYASSSRDAIADECAECEDA